MVIKGRRRGGARDLANHLQKADDNEAVYVREISGFSFEQLTISNLEKAIQEMEAIGYGKGDKRNLFHTILAPAPGETLTTEQQKRMVEHYAKRMGFKDHQYTLVEHWKNRKQHFHLVFNIVSPITGKTHELKWSKRKEWAISREFEGMFGLSRPDIKGREATTADMQRGKRTGIDPRVMRREVTTIYENSQTTQEFIGALRQAGYILAKGRKGQLVIVDRKGDTHGLMRRIEGQKLSDLRRKLVGIEKLDLPSHATAVYIAKRVKGDKGLNAIQVAKTRPLNSASTAYHLRTAHARNYYKTVRVKSDFTHVARLTCAYQQVERERATPIRPVATNKGGWPLQAIIAWETWGHLNPPLFFNIWSELAPTGFHP